MSAYEEALLSDIDHRVEIAVKAAREELLAAVAQMVQSRPQPAPQVRVAAPHVVVQPDLTIPEITLPPIELPDIVVDVAALAAVLAAVADSNAGVLAALEEILVELRAPTVRTVSRGRDGQIDSITDRRA